jgi:uncharacterized damage-inducible protein DinB
MVLPGRDEGHRARHPEGPKRTSTWYGSVGRRPLVQSKFPQIPESLGSTLGSTDPVGATCRPRAASAVLVRPGIRSLPMKKGTAQSILTRATTIDGCRRRRRMLAPGKGNEMTSTELLADAFERIRDTVHRVLEGLSSDLLAARLDSEANSIAWLVWHLTRVQDDHIADLARTEQVWTSSGWAERFALNLDTADTGYGHGPTQVAAVTVDAESLRGYHDAVFETTIRFLDHTADADLDHVVDERWNPPVTMGVRLVSIISDALQHAGQAALVRGILERE